MLSNKEFIFEIPSFMKDGGNYDLRVNVDSGINHLFDSVNHNAIFLPEAKDEGEHSLNVVIKNLDTGKEFERSYRLIVLHYKEFYRTLPLTAGSSAVIDLPGHPMDQTEVVIPEDIDSTGIELIFHEAKGSSDQNDVPSYFYIESSVEIKAPIDLKLSNENVGVFSVVDDLSTGKSEEQGFFTGTFHKVCPSELKNADKFFWATVVKVASVIDSRYAVPETDRGFENDRGVKFDVHFDEGLLESNNGLTKLGALEKEFKKISNADPRVKIYFKENMKAGTLGMVTAAFDDAMFLNGEILMSDEWLLETIYIHELEHLRQNKELRCKGFDNDIRWLKESAAEYSSFVNSSRPGAYLDFRYSELYQQRDGKPHYNPDVYKRFDSEWSYVTNGEGNGYFFSAYLWEVLNNLADGVEKHYREIFKHIGNDNYSSVDGLYIDFFNYLDFLQVDKELLLKRIESLKVYSSGNNIFGDISDYFGPQSFNRINEISPVEKVDLAPFASKTYKVIRKDSVAVVLKISSQGASMVYDSSTTRLPAPLNPVLSQRPGCNIKYSDVEQGIDYILIMPKERREYGYGYPILCPDDFFVSLVNPTFVKKSYELKVDEDRTKLSTSLLYDPESPDTVVNDTMLAMGLSSNRRCPTAPMYNFTDDSSNFYWHYQITAPVLKDIDGNQLKVTYYDGDGWVEDPSNPSFLQEDYIRWTFVGAYEGTPKVFSGSLERGLRDVFGRRFGIRYMVETFYPANVCP
jgi:hypothetical protein